MISEALQRETLELLKKLVACPSLSGQEQGVADILKGYLRENGFTAPENDRYGDLVAGVAGSRPGIRLLFDGHMDTVPAKNAEDWTTPPFEPVIREGKLFGRGTSDMKGAVAAFAVAAAQYLREKGRNFAGELWFAGVVQEECFEGVCAREVAKRVRPDLVIIGEASEGNLKLSQRGRAEIVLETFGVPCHSANPQKGVNAATAMCALIHEIMKLPVTRDPRMVGDGILVLTDIKSDPYPGASVVPHYCRATFDRRLLVGETRESVLKPIEAIIEAQKRLDPTLNARVSYPMGSAVCATGETVEAERFFAPWWFAADERVLRVKAAMEGRGLAPAITGYSFCTNGSYYAGEAGIPTFGYGPSREDLAHTVDEHITLKDLYDAVDGYLVALHALLD
ncbi:MAG: YgeY family selenium metabolism-linked hydrolase [Clostridia bacterium]|nr:YgeY family selenium metabolism-linked hydrolase [Clostridia bacterium]MBR0422744.1 YgeY family selenium metabolism-linked hydrolase [Clostridia bacterium]